MIDGGLTNENFAGLDNLEYAVLEGVSFSSPVPSVFGTLASLKYLYLTDSYITGDLSFMKTMPQIVELWIDSNPGLSGPIPTEVGNLGTLASFSVVKNGLVGPLPTEMGLMTELIQFWCYDNNMNGDIPTEFGGLPRLKVFQVEGNDFSGSMPDEVCANTEDNFGALEVIGADCDEVDVSHW